MAQPTPIDNDLAASVSSADTPTLSNNVIVFNLNADFTVHAMQEYTLVDNAWEVYVGRFASANQDGLFLYDRVLGEARLLSFNTKLQVVHYQAIHSIDPNWEVHSGDFSGSGQAQVLLYNPSTGNAQMEVLKSDLSVANEVTFSSWGTNMALYVGHFGTPTLNVMLYDPQAGQSTFIAFDSTLAVSHQYTVSGLGQNWQVLVGAFLDRSRCLAAHDCSTGDDILALDRVSGQLQEYIFSFGNQYQVVDNRSQAFVENAVASTVSLLPVDTSYFSLQASFITNIHDEELY